MRILNFGSCNIDYVYSLDQIVRAGETTSSHRREVFAGGKGLNQSIAAARAGITVFHAGCVGEDGAFLVKMLEESGVDTHFMRTVPGPSGHAVIQVDGSGENAIIIHAGANAMITDEYIDEVLSHFTAGDLVMLQNEITGNAHIVDKAKEKGMITVLNPSPIDRKIGELDFTKIDCIVINEIEGQALSGESDPFRAITALRRRYPALRILLTLGEKGCLYDCPDNRYAQSAFEVKVRDTTAAGDTFTGYFIAALARNAPPKDCLREACAASALAVSKKGAAPSIPMRADVGNALKILKPKETNTDDKRRKQIDEYMEENLRTASLSDLSRKFGYSSYYMGKLVKALTGKNFSDYLFEKRCVKAAKMLSDTDLPIAAVIHEVGYDNGSFFRKKFFEAYGQMPLQYRRSMRQNND